MRAISWISLMAIAAFSVLRASGPLIDSDMTIESALAGTKAPKSITSCLRLVNVEYYSLDGRLHRGQLLLHKDAVRDVREIFDSLKAWKFPVAKAIPISKYGWSDEASMKDNNTSSFCYRAVAGTKRLSRHAYGKAVDINPFFNPVVHTSGRISPKGARYRPGYPGTFDAAHPAVREFLKRGWRWGGSWKDMHDNHHFDMGLSN